ncbi:Transposase [Nonomuraea coxensis DSM 45129]|uniref:Transposase n=4 Tax=Nonomuraea coxensis TaxID=404386 RepID=A0ABX8TUG5_9ACTN|nr:Transposase [Nonomuraea coxensis DSM 45129]QYC45153.1 Transposase [Nonomuraea coxensis DSM 45129]QYC45267.1 Transposase [Nonomuraea coxensis DSM 45129]
MRNPWLLWIMTVLYAVNPQGTTGVHNPIETSTEATLLLDLEGLHVVKVERDHDGHRIVHVVTADESARACPACGVFSVTVKERVATRPRDLRAGDSPYTLLWHKLRWSCREPLCPRGSFTEQIPQVSAGMRTTARLRRACGRAIADGGRTVTQAARDHRLSWPIAMRELRAYATEVLPDQPEPTPVIGIDEIRRGRPRWEQDPDTGKYRLIADRWHVGFTDLATGQGLLGQVEGRLSTSVAAWLNARPKAWRTALTHVAIDMCQTFRCAVRAALPHAIIVVDHFHLVQLANGKLADLRRRLTWKMRDRRGRTGDPEYDHRRLLRSNREDLTDEQIAILERDLTRIGTYGRHILAGWHAKEKLRYLLALARTNPARSTIAHRLHAFYIWCADHPYLPELVTLAETVASWWKEIEAFLLTGITNAKSEGTNRVIKLEARCAYGFRNPANQRLRSRCATTRESRNRAIPA